MNPLLWAFISLQLNLPPRPVLPPVVWDVTTTQRLYTCRDSIGKVKLHRCYYNRSMQVNHSVFWRQYPVYIKA